MCTIKNYNYSTIYKIFYRDRYNQLVHNSRIIPIASNKFVMDIDDYFLLLRSISSTIVSAISLQVV